VEQAKHMVARAVSVARAYAVAWTVSTVGLRISELLLTEKTNMAEKTAKKTCRMAEWTFLAK
jgi:hypothetical protein